MTNLFHNCQKIVVFSEDDSKVLLCKRKGEEDYDGVFSFIGGKMETTDETIVLGLKREKDEEVGKDFKIKLYPTFNTMVLFQKKDGNSMILPHYFSRYEEGEIKLNDEYSEYKWVPVDEIDSFEPVIPTVQKVVKELLRLKKIMEEEEFVLI